MDPILVSLTETTKAVQTLKDIPFERAADPITALKLDNITESILLLSNVLLNYVSDSTILFNENNFKPLNLQHCQDSYSNITEVTDILLEKANQLVDKSNQSMPNEVELYPLVQPIKKKQKNPNNNGHASIKPQERFKSSIDNSNTPFVRKIQFKPNAKRPLDQTTDPNQFL